MVGRVLGTWPQKAVAWMFSGLRGRNLRREFADMQSEKFWSSRERANTWRLRRLLVLFGLRSSASNLRNRWRDLRYAVTSTLKWSLFGALFIVAIVGIENVLIYRCSLELLTSDPSSSIDTFPAVAVQVLAAFLGFYLATVGIVLGNAYHDVSRAVRDLVLDNAQTRLYLGFIGLSIGAGLVIILLQDADVLATGYLVTGVYACLVCISGWSFATLGFGAFNLLNPIELSREPLRILNRAVWQLDSKNPIRNDVVLRSTAIRVDHALENLAEIIRLTKDRRSVDRRELAGQIDILLRQVVVYARNRHRLPDESAWFTREISYPRWFEYNQNLISIALETSTPLPTEYVPVSDWLERRAAELVAASLDACIITDDTDAALRIVGSSGQVARSLAGNSRFDEAASFVRIIADSCWRPSLKNATANDVAYAPHHIMTEALLGWKDAISLWSEEINRVVEDTDWDNQNTREVDIQGTGRVRCAAQDLLREIHAENSIEMARITPAWHLRSALASECIISLREFADSLVETLQYYVDPQPIESASPEARSTTGSQALQMLSKAELVAETLQRVVGSLEAMQQGHDKLPVPEVANLATRLGSLRSTVIEELGKAASELRPEQSKSNPDYFGQTIFTLLHHTEQAISDGQVGSIERVFPSALSASLKLYDHLDVTYRPPSYELTPAIFNPILDVLELSGLALIYEELRGDDSAEPIRQAWLVQDESRDELAGLAAYVLDVLDRAQIGLPPLV